MLSQNKKKPDILELTFLGPIEERLQGTTPKSWREANPENHSWNLLIWTEAVGAINEQKPLNGNVEKLLETEYGLV